MGSDCDLELVNDIPMKRYKLKTKVLAPGADDSQVVRMRNRVLRCICSGIKLEADSRHAELILRLFGLQIGRVEKVPGSKPAKKEASSSDGGDDDVVQEIPKFEPQEVREHRSLVARSNYIKADRPDVQSALEELPRSMSLPTEADVLAALKVAGYLLDRRRVALTFPPSQSGWSRSFQRR